MSGGIRNQRARCLVHPNHGLILRSPAEDFPLLHSLHLRRLRSHRVARPGAPPRMRRHVRLPGPGIQGAAHAENVLLEDGDYSAGDVVLDDIFVDEGDDKNAGRGDLEYGEDLDGPTSPGQQLPANMRLLFSGSVPLEPCMFSRLSSASALSCRHSKFLTLFPKPHALHTLILHPKPSTIILNPAP